MHAPGNPDAGSDAKDAMQRLGAVMAGPDADAVLAQELGDIMRMQVIDREGHAAEALGRIFRPQHAHAGNGT